MSAKIIKKGCVVIQTKKNFKKSCEHAYLYILKEETKSFVILFKSDAYLPDDNIQKYRKERNSNIIISKKINSRMEANKISTVRAKSINVPTNFIFSLKFSITSKLKICVLSMFELNEWVSQINMLADMVKATTMLSFRSMKLIFLRVFKKSESKIARGINGGTNVKKLENNYTQTEKYYVYRIVSNPPFVIFNSHNHAILELDSKELKIKINSVGCEPSIMKWEYSQIKRYGVSNHIFSFDAVETIVTDAHEKKIEKVSYFLTVYQQNYVKKSFEKYYLKTTIKSMSFEIENVQNPLIEYQSRFQTVKSDIIFPKIIDTPDYGIQSIQIFNPIEKNNKPKENNGGQDLSKIIFTKNYQKMCNSIVSYQPETHEWFSTLMNNCPTSTKLNSDVTQTTNNCSQEFSKANTLVNHSLKSPFSISPPSKSINAFFKSPDKTKTSYKDDSINENEFKVVSHINQNPKIIPTMFTGNSSRSKLNRST